MVVRYRVPGDHLHIRARLLLCQYLATINNRVCVNIVKDLTSWSRVLFVGKGSERRRQILSYLKQYIRQKPFENKNFTYSVHHSSICCMIWLQEVMAANADNHWPTTKTMMELRIAQAQFFWAAADQSIRGRRDRSAHNHITSYGGRRLGHRRQTCMTETLLEQSNLKSSANHTFANIKSIQTLGTWGKNKCRGEQLRWCLCMMGSGLAAERVTAFQRNQ